jgi:Iap family predicted aminopeptidase
MKSKRATWLKRAVALGCVLVACAPGDATSIRRTEVPSDVLLERLRLAPESNRARHDQLVKLFADNGCVTTNLDVPHEPPNVFCAMPGDSDSIIFVGAHFDKVARGHGVVDNWSGAALLPSLFQALKIVKRRHTLVFMGFSAEEKGLVGSSYYVRHLPKPDRAKIHAMIAIDTLGLSPTKIWSSRADRALVIDLINVSQSLNHPVSGMNVDYVGDTDSTPFRDAKIPTITFHSLTTETYRILHSEKDTYAAIDPKAYVDSCHLIADYVAYLDEVLDKDASATTQSTK